MCLIVYSGVQHILSCAFCFDCFRLVYIDVANYPALSILGCQFVFYLTFIVCDFKIDCFCLFYILFIFLLQLYSVCFFLSLIMLRSSLIKRSLDLGELEHNSKWWIYICIYVLLNIDMNDIETFCFFYVLLYIYYQ